MAESVQHFRDVDDVSAEELDDVLERTRSIRSSDDRRARPGPARAVRVEKTSPRTRVSFEAGMTELGGHAIFLGPEDTQLGRGEPLKDTARALSGYVDGIMARVFDHAHIEELAAYADVPVINGLTDDAHPCQTLADLLTIADRFGDLEGCTAAWVGDGNNVARSFALGCAMTGIDLTVATPNGFGLGDDVLDRAASLGSRPSTTHDPTRAVADADVVYTDVWVSMGEEDERQEKLAAFEGFQVNETLLEHAPDAHVMHCLPAHRGEEISDAVLESGRAIVWQQAENRMHAQKGLLTWLLE